MMPIGSTVIYDGKTWNNQFYGIQPVWGVKNLPSEDEHAVKVTKIGEKKFGDYLLEKINKVNNDQIQLMDLEEKVVTGSDDIDPQDVTIAMAKAELSLNLMQNVIARLTGAWQEICTTGGM